MARLRRVSSGTPTSDKKRVAKEAALQRLRTRFAQLQQAGHSNQQKLSQLVESHNLVIPSNEGCIDTIRISLPWPVVSKDRGHLQQHGFLLKKNLHKAKKMPDGSLAEPDPGTELWSRESDGCRVELRPQSETKRANCAIEVSLPRVLGIPNHRLHELSQLDTQHALEILMESILPWTTWRADTADEVWAVVRLDIARDRPGDIASVIESYQHTRWRRVKTPPFPRKMSNGLWWKSSSESQTPHQLRIYDKGVEMLNSATTSEALKDAPGPGTVIRVERRFRGNVGLSVLSKLLDGGDSAIRSGGRLVPLVDRDFRGKLARPPLSLHGLHLALAHEIALLRSAAKAATTKHEVLASAYVRDPVFRSGFEVAWGKATVNKIRALAASIEQAGGVDLLKVVYGA